MNSILTDVSFLPLFISILTFLLGYLIVFTAPPKKYQMTSTRVILWFLGFCLLIESPLGILISIGSNQNKLKFVILYFLILCFLMIKSFRQHK